MLSPDLELPLASIIHPDSIAVFSPAAAAHATGIAELAHEPRYSPLTRHRTMVVGVVRGGTVDNPSATIPVAAVTPPPPIAFSDGKHRSTTVSHPDAAAVAGGSPGVVFFTSGFAQLLSQLYFSRRICQTVRLSVALGLSLYRPAPHYPKGQTCAYSPSMARRANANPTAASRGASRPGVWGHLSGAYLDATIVASRWFRGSGFQPRPVPIAKRAV